MEELNPQGYNPQDYENPVMNHNFVRVNFGTHDFAKYLREVSGGNEWYWKSFPHFQVFFSPNGKWIASCYYEGKNKSDTVIYIPRSYYQK
jgi:hypothetical protein